MNILLLKIILLSFLICILHVVLAVSVFETEVRLNFSEAFFTAFVIIWCEIEMKKLKRY